MRRPITTLLVLVLAACEGPPEPSPAGEPPASFVDEDCQACHADVAEQWARSRHHSAFHNEDFARAYAREPRPFCRDCHAPALARPQPLRRNQPDAEQLGVGCIDCHVDPAQPDEVLHEPGSPAHTDAPHGLRAVAGFATHSCARCHEFDFPATSRRPPGTMMQTTMREHRSSAHADRSCATCHFPLADHSLASTRDDAAMRAALQVEARRDGTTLTLELRPHEVGHAFPTGDLYRRLAVHARLWRAGEPIAEQLRLLDREFPAWRLADGRRNRNFTRPVVDDRLHGPTTITLELTPADALAPNEPTKPTEPTEPTEIEWWVDYERVDERDDLAPERSTVADTVRLAEGRL